MIDEDMTLLTEFMAEQFDPKLFVIRERYKFWSDLKRKPGETITQLAARIRQDASTGEFSAIDPPPPPPRRCYVYTLCSMQTEAFLKAVFKEKERYLTFAKAIQIAIEIEEATKLAKENVCPTNEAYAVRSQKYPARSKPNQPALATKANNNNASAPPCGRCDSSEHTG